jgi:hypothetical protein
VEKAGFAGTFASSRGNRDEVQLGDGAVDITPVVLEWEMNRIGAK